MYRGVQYKKYRDGTKKLHRLEFADHDALDSNDPVQGRVIEGDGFLKVRMIRGGGQYCAAAHVPQLLYRILIKTGMFPHDVHKLPV